MAAEEEVLLPLFEAVFDGDVAEVGRFLDEDGRLVEATAGPGCRPLLLAVTRGRVDMVRLLLGRGAEIEARNDKGFTPLHLAVAYNHEEVVEVLLDWGADARTAAPHGPTPLMLAVLASTGAVKRLVRSLGRQGLNAQTDTGSTAFLVACGSGFADIARLLLLEGADHTIAQYSGTTARMEAESKGHEECVALIQVRTHMTGFVLQCLRLLGCMRYSQLRFY
jgi:ankyrin repeat protein